MARRVLALCLLIALSSQKPAPGAEYKPPVGPQNFAHVVYDAIGNVELDEGTVELWVRNDFDPRSQMTNRFYLPISYFSLSYDPKVSAPISLITRHVTGGKDVFATVDGASGGVHVSELGWKVKGEWHYFALTWKYQDGQYTRQLYVDGKFYDKAVTDQKLMALRENAKIYIGAYYFNCCFAAVDQLRISAVERTAEEIKEAFEKGLRWDRLTLLFDDFDKIEKDPLNGMFTQAEKGKTGTIEGNYKIVDGRFGKALQLHVVEEETK